nr:hypothetical protein [Prevotella sp.]
MGKLNFKQTICIGADSSKRRRISHEYASSFKLLSVVLALFATLYTQNANAWDETVCKYGSKLENVLSKSKKEEKGNDAKICYLYNVGDGKM